MQNQQKRNANSAHRMHPGSFRKFLQSLFKSTTFSLPQLVVFPLCESINSNQSSQFSFQLLSYAAETMGLLSFYACSRRRHYCRAFHNRIP